MAIMDPSADGMEAFDGSSFLLKHDHDFLQHDSQHDAHAKHDEQQLPSSQSPPGNLSLSQLHGLSNAIHLSRPDAGDANAHLSNGWNMAQQPDGVQSASSRASFASTDSSQPPNSLGLLGSDFTRSSSSPTPMPLRQIEQQQQARQPQQQQRFSGFHPLSGFDRAPAFVNPANGHEAAFQHQAPWLHGDNVNPFLQGDMMAGGATLQRQHSISSLSDASSSSVLNDGASVGSQSQFDPTSPVRTSFTPLQSPMGITHSISSLAGLAIGTPQQNIMNPHALEEYVANHRHSFAGEHHEQLLSLAGMNAASQSFASSPVRATVPSTSFMGPPPPSMAASSNGGNDNRRRSASVVQGRQDLGNLDDATPMPPSQQMFSGHPSSSDVSSLAASSNDASSQSGPTQSPAKRGSDQLEQAYRPPTTPRSARQSIQQTPQRPVTMPQSGSANSFVAPFQTPQKGNGLLSSPADDSSALGSSIAGSAFSAPRLNRMDSFDSFTTGSAISTPSSETGSGRTDPGGIAGRSLEATIAEHEAKLASFAGHPSSASASLQRMASSRTSGSELDLGAMLGDRTLSPASSKNGAMSGPPSSTSSAAMSRVSSAPAHQHQMSEMNQYYQQQQHGDKINMPTTPVRSIPSSSSSSSASNATGLGRAMLYEDQMPYTPHSTAMSSGMPGFQTPQVHPYHNMQRIHELTMSAPHMAASRSMGSLPSPGLMTSPISPMDMHNHQRAAAAAAAAAASNNPFGSPPSHEDDGMVRTPSSGVSRTATPRSRGRNASQPPLIVSSADKTHVCFCGKRFKRLEHLKRHNRVHTQERPHPCPAPGCNKWFGRTDNLTQHLKTHYRTLGRTSESLLQITQAAAVAKASGPEARGLITRASSGGLMDDANAAMDDVMMGMGPSHPQQQHSQQPQQQQRQHEARHDPHAAAAAAAAQAVSKTNMKRRITISNDMLGRPISLDSPAADNSLAVGAPASRSP